MDTPHALQMRIRMRITAAILMLVGVYLPAVGPLSAEAETDVPAKRQAGAGETDETSSDSQADREPWRQRWRQRTKKGTFYFSPPWSVKNQNVPFSLVGEPESERGWQHEDRAEPEARRAAAREVLREIHPRLAERLARARQRSPERAERMWGRLGERLTHLAALRESDPQLYRLRVRDQRANLRTMRFMRALRQARENNRTEAVERLTPMLRKHLQSHFDTRQRIREYELARLERRIERMRDELRKRRSRKDALIDRVIARARGEAVNNENDNERDNQRDNERDTAPDSPRASESDGDSRADAPHRQRKPDRRNNAAP